MNMMVNTSELVGNEAETSKISGTALKRAVSKLVASWEKKQAARVKKVGGLGFIAVSLAACNSSSDDTATTTTTTPTTTTPTVTTPAPTSSALTANADTIYGTAGADAVTGDQTTYTAGDILADATTGDADTVVISATANVTATPTIVGFESVTFNATGTLSSGGVEFQVDVANINGANITLDATSTGTLITGAQADNMGSGNVSTGTAIADLDISTDLDADIVVTMANATANSLDITNGGGASDDLTVDAGTNAFTLNGATSTEDLVVTSGNMNITAAAIAGNITLTGTGTITVTDAAAAVGTATISNAGATDGTDITITDMDSATTVVITSAGAIDADDSTDGLDAATTVTLTATESSLFTADVATTINLNASDPGATPIQFTMDAALVDTLNLGGTTPIIVDVEDPADIDTETVASTNTSQAYIAMSEAGGNFDVDFAGVANGIIIYGEADNAASTYDDLIEGATVGIDAANANNQTGTVTFDHDVDATTTTANSLNLKVIDLTTANDTDVTATAATLAFNDTDTLNIDIGAGQTLELTDLTGDSLDTVVMTGATFTMGAGGGFHGDVTQDDLVVNASAMTGVVTYRFDNVDGGATTLTTGAGADIIDITNAHINGTTTTLSITTGAGNDTVNVVTSNNATIDGGTGTDTLALGAVDYSGQTLTLTSVEVITNIAAGNNFTVTGAVLNGKNFLIDAAAAAGNEDHIVVIDSLTMDLSGLAFSSAASEATDTFTMDGADSALALSITGSSIQDNITGGNGADTIVGGGGTDVISGDSGADTITLGTGNADIVLANEANIRLTADSVTGFNTGDDIQIQATNAGAFGDLHTGNGTAFNGALTGDVATFNVAGGAAALGAATDNVIAINANTADLTVGYATIAAVNTALDTAVITENGGGTFANGDAMVIAWYNTTSATFDVGVLTVVGGDGINGADETYESLLQIAASTTTLAEVAASIDFIA